LRREIEISLPTLPKFYPTKLMELRQNIGRFSFIIFLMVLYVSLFFLPQLAAIF